MMRRISHGLCAMVKQEQHNSQRNHDPWTWAAWMSILILLWTSWEWRHHHEHVTGHLQPTLQSLEQEYLSINQQMKRTTDKRRRLLADIIQMKSENRRYEAILQQQYEGRTILSQTSSLSPLSSQNTPLMTNVIDSWEDEVAEQFEQIYLNRIDDLQYQIVRWNEKRLFREFGNRFPTFKFQARLSIIPESNNDHPSAQFNHHQDVSFQIRFNLKPFPVEIALLYEMVKAQQFDEFFMEFVLQRDANSTSPVLALQRIQLPTYLPRWPVHHHVRIVQEETVDQTTPKHWFIVAEPLVHENNNYHGTTQSTSSNKAPSLEQQEASPEHLAHILKGFDVLRDFCDTHESSGGVVQLRLEIVAAERVIPRRISHVPLKQEEF